MTESFLALLAFLGFLFSVFVFSMIIIFLWRVRSTPPPLGLGLVATPFPPLGLGLATPAPPIRLDLPSPPCMSCRKTKKILQFLLLAKKIEHFERERDRVAVREFQDQDGLLFFLTESFKSSTQRGTSC